MTTPTGCMSPNGLCTKYSALNTKLTPIFSPAQINTHPKTYPVIFWNTMPGDSNRQWLHSFSRRTEHLLLTKYKINALVWTSIFRDDPECRTVTVKVLVDFPEYTVITNEIRRDLFAERTGVGLWLKGGVEMPELMEGSVNVANHASLVRLRFFDETRTASVERRLLNLDYLPLRAAI
ncbi:hypothetical protein BJY01DRAFT_251111 [Aspergillus pseudoustus]|uniref:Uncharacterized protein n=1 Tax=Aspergillus pseudoustus TaxID=1810923 RepID=A0ABR4JDI0_9EURO